MSNAALQNAMRLQAQRAVADLAFSRIGQVTSYNPNNYTARVALQPEGTIVTGWLPIGANWIGNGWGMFAPPNIGDMVSVVFLDGDLNAGYIESRFWNFQDLPLLVQSGEFWLVHQSGQFVKLTNDGKLAVSDGHGATVTLNGDGTISSASSQWNHSGNMKLTGNFEATGTVTGDTDVVGGGKSLKTHTHSGVTTGGGTSGPPV